MTALSTELEASVTDLRAKHTKLINVVNAYRTGTVGTSKQDLLEMAAELEAIIPLEEKTLLGQIVRAGDKVPSLLLDFENQRYGVGDRRIESFSALQSILNFTRSTGGGRFNEDGVYEWVAADVPRIDYDPVTKVCRGLLVEERRTNHFPSSNGDYTFGNTPTFTPNAVISPDGTMNATLINSGASPNRYELTLTSGLTTGQVFTISWWELPINYTTSTCLSPQSFVNATTISGTFALVQTLPSGWKRYSVQASIIDGSQLARFRLYFSGGMSGIVDPCAIWGIQIESGRFLTSLIPTAGSAVTRAADIASVPISDWYNPMAGTVKCDFVGVQSDRTYAGIWGFFTGSSSSRIAAYAKSGVSRFVVHSPISGTRGGANIDLAVGQSSAVVYSTSQGVRSALNGLDSVSYPEYEQLTTSKLCIGRSALDSPSEAVGTGHIKSLTYYPYAMTQTELQELTA